MPMIRQVSALTLVEMQVFWVVPALPVSEDGGSGGCENTDGSAL